MPTKPLPQQLDIFLDSQDVVLRNRASDALLARDPSAARAAVARLRDAFPGDEALPPMALLAEALTRSTAEDRPLPDHDHLAAARRRLTGQIGPAAARVFNDGDAERFMRQSWLELASRCQALTFEPSRPDDHAAPVCLQAQAWREAVAAVEGIESWRRIPAPLSWMAQARCRLGELDTCWPLLAELAWLSPRRLQGVVRAANDPSLTRLLTRFKERFDDRGEVDDLAWFPAWLLTEAPALAQPLGLAWPSQHSPAERGMRLLIELLGLERQGRHPVLIERRRALRDLNLPLYDAYMASR